MTEPEHSGDTRPAPDALTLASFALLLMLAALLFSPLLGGPLPSPYLVAALLVLRLGLQLLRARRDPRLRRPASWALDLILIGLMFSVASQQPGG